MFVYTTGIINNNISVLITIDVDESKIKPQNPNFFDKANALHIISTGKIIKIIDEDCNEYNIARFSKNSYQYSDYKLGDNIIYDTIVYLSKARALSNKISKNFTGSHTTYHTNGRISKISTVINGCETMEKETFDENGNKTTKSNYIDKDKKTYCLKTFYNNGNLHHECCYNDINQYHGDYKNYDVDGNLILHKVYDAGKLIDTIIDFDYNISCKKILSETEIYYKNIINTNNDSNDNIHNNIRYFLKKIDQLTNLVDNNKRLYKIKISILLFEYMNLDHIVNFIKEHIKFNITVLAKIDELINEQDNLDEIPLLKQLCITLKNKITIKLE